MVTDHELYDLALRQDEVNACFDQLLTVYKAESLYKAKQSVKLTTFASYYPSERDAAFLYTALTL